MIKALQIMQKKAQYMQNMLCFGVFADNHSSLSDSLLMSFSGVFKSSFSASLLLLSFSGLSSLCVTLGLDPRVHSFLDSRDKPENDKREDDEGFLDSRDKPENDKRRRKPENDRRGYDKRRKPESDEIFLDSRDKPENDRRNKEPENDKKGYDKRENNGNIIKHGRIMAERSSK